MGVGIRQQIVHYPSSVQFQGQEDEKGRIRPVAYLWGIDVKQGVDFERDIRTMLHDWCEWLDRLEELLAAQLGGIPAALPGSQTALEFMSRLD
jgi:hypothetical protein